MTRIIESISQWRELRHSSLLQNKIIGFVPTMGALHAGHQSLLKRCRAENEITVLSIFVNPTQFNDQNDFQHYPKTLDDDLQVASAEHIDYVLLPRAAAIYFDNYQYRISEHQISKTLCGQHRPGHFDGVLTVVMKLLQLVKPSRAYFGEKDFQQYLLVKAMSEAFFLDIDIIPCATVRDPDGLALSSRNQRLTPKQRKQAAEFPNVLQMKLSLTEMRQRLETLGFVVDYIEEFANRRCAAVHIGNVRLIDNFPI